MPVTKQQWRRRILADRDAVPEDVHRAEAATLATAVRGLAGTVCAYCPTGSEPGSRALLDALVDAGAEVLLPVVPPQPGPLRWAGYAGPAHLRRGRFGIPEPDGPQLAPSAVARAATLLVPALAVDARGRRLGRGAGYYDRTLPLARPGTAIIAVLRDSELVDELPAEAHDVPVTGTLTPGRGLVTYHRC